MSGIMGHIIRTAEKANPPEDGDYIDEEGFLCCGKCHTRRQVEIDMPDLSREPYDPTVTIRRKVPVSCRCRAETQRKKELREQQEKEMEIRKEISKRKRKRRREENHYASKEVMQDRKEALQETLDSIAGLGSSSAAAAAAEGLVSAAAAGAGSGAVSAEISAAAAGGGVTAGTVSMDAAAADAAADVAV